MTHANSHPHEVSLEDLVNGDHERCANPRCRLFFPFVEGKLDRVRGIDDQWYCDNRCASAEYLTPRRYTGL